MKDDAVAGPIEDLEDDDEPVDDIEDEDTSTEVDEDAEVVAAPPGPIEDPMGRHGPVPAQEQSPPE